MKGLREGFSRAALDQRRPAFFFDPQDYDLVELLDDFVRKDQRPERLHRLFNTDLHPRGIKELAASRERRIAYAVVRLLDSLDAGLAAERLVALKALRDEIIEGGGEALLLNTGRALLETMKHLVRERGDYWHQVELAHDFFSAVSGRPHEVRRKLAEYHLLEMSEKWNQVAFDHHVHDAYTKGRKAPTHLIVDAWIKGIREMTVIYYFLVSPEAVLELIEAASVMGVAVQPGIEVSGRFRGKYVQLIWTPRGLSTPREYQELFAEPRTRAFFDEGRQVVAYQTKNLLDLLHAFNRDHLPRLNAEVRLALPPLDPEAFLRFVGVGQPSRSHLADYLHQQLVEHVEARLAELRAQWERSAPGERAELEARLERLDRLTADDLKETYLSAEANPAVANVHLPLDDAPGLLKLSPAEMVARLKDLRSGSGITLNPTNLSPADVLEILYDCKGAITHLEIFNLKDYQRGQNPWVREIGRVRRVLNSHNPIACKRMIHELVAQVEEAEPDPSARTDQVGRLRHILAHMPELLSFYSQAPLLARVGTDSTGRARAWAGMGLAVAPTLTHRARREFQRRPGTREIVPVTSEAVLQSTWRPRHSHLKALDLAFGVLRHLPGLRDFGRVRDDSFVLVPDATLMADRGNILTLGGVPERRRNGLALTPPGGSDSHSGSASGWFRWRFLNTNAKNVAKILIGLIPAFFSFYLTNDWWVLAWLGAFIWFGITGLRNIIQTVVGGAGLIRSKLLKWKDLVSWSRVADSLLYTGLSVPLLDDLVKHLILDEGMGITTKSAPWALYALIGLANGVYIFGHNVWRGLPRQAAVGNFLFRTPLAIPVAFGINALALKLLVAGGMEVGSAFVMLQAWAAVINKLGSDIVAGFIEGIADRNVNLSQRMRDYQSKLSRLLDVHGRLEALFPDVDVVESLASPKEFFRTLGKEAGDLEKQQIINALDLMYMWMYQPRARAVFEQQLGACAPEERQIILRSQRLLERKRPISEMFIHDLVGKNFSPPLAFYLDRSASYLRDMRELAGKLGVEWNRTKTLEPAGATPSGSADERRAAAG